MTEISDTGTAPPLGFLKELENLVNRYSIENESNTPDFILARYLRECLVAFAVAVRERETWYGRPAVPTTWPKTIEEP